jgi:cyclic pyranopterin monophosphate synthase
MELSHYADDGSSQMVDISSKQTTSRTARAAGFVKMQGETIQLIRNKLIPKGNVFEIAKIAGIIAAKKTSELIPMCHNLLLNYIDVKVSINDEENGVAIESLVKMEGKTGAEMEALTAVSIAALTVYDMCKAVDKTMSIDAVRLIEKRGGKTDFIE